ncbi:MAG: glycoside hydrolase family 9 protein [Bacteroidales bacterium]|nr:glycoside hydrolase family 9 protein [Bacteroidales bacterium]
MKSLNLIQAIVIAVFLLVGNTLQAQFDYEDALEKSIWFFDANKCGPDAGDNVFKWRGKCHTSDAHNGVDLTGGYHDAGDHVKFGLPQTWSAATLGFALYEFRDAFDKSGTTDQMLRTLKHFTDFFLKCHVNDNKFYYEVGDGGIDHGYWGSPEKQKGARPAFAATPSTPASDVCGEAAAALSLMYLNYKDVNASYANKCLKAAKSIYKLGKNHLGRSSDHTSGGFYKSSSHYDDLSWGAIWLSVATGDDSYLDPVDGWLDIPNDYGDNNYDKHWAPAWDDATVFVLLKMADLTGNQKYITGVLNNLEWYRDDLQRTPAGLPWLNQWGVLRYASAEAGVGYMAAKYFEYAGYLETGDRTMSYILGDNPRKGSYLTNWGKKSPKHPHHRANEPIRGGAVNGMVGALVGGPNSTDGYTDNVNDYIMNEVALDYNASFILGMAGKIYFDYNPKPTVNINPTATLTAPKSGASFKQGTSVTLKATAEDVDGVIKKVEFYVGNAKVGEDKTAPYTAEWFAALDGDYKVTAKAIDDRNGMGTSKAANIRVTSNNPPPTTPNLALNKKATASSLENGGFPASNAVDNDNQSRWSSEFSDPQWLAVDLGGDYMVNRVILRWEAAYGSAYSIEVSDNGKNWTEVVSIAGNGGVDDIVFEKTRARHIRMYGTSRATPYGYSLYEFEVYGDIVADVPNAVAKAVPTEGFAPLPVSFDASASSDPNNDPLTYLWNFGDGSTSTAMSPEHTYQGIGSYTATLTVDDGNGNTDTDEVVITVNDPNGQPRANFVYSPETGCPPVEICFDGSSSSDPDGDPLTFEWKIDGSVVNSEEKFCHTFSVVGNYKVTLTVTDPGGKSDAISYTVKITDCTPQAVIIAQPESGKVPLTVSFDGSTSVNPRGGLLTYAWDFGDGVTATGAKVQHTYTSINTFIATLTVTNSQNESDEASVSISVEDTVAVCDFGTPLAQGLPTTGYVRFFNIHTMGDGIDLSNVTEFVINWDAQNNGLWQLSFQTNDGKPNWWTDLRTYLTHNLNSVQPAFLFKNTGFTGFDGEYWVALDGTNFVMVEKNGNSMIYFSNSATPPACFEFKSTVSISSDEDIIVYPNPFHEQITIRFDNHDVKKVEVYSISGKLLFSKGSAFDDELVINLDSENIVIVKVTTDSDLIEKTVIRQR